MTRYVLGFAFDEAGDRVVLIQKTKPAWQAGKYNGVGGKVEENETMIDAMVREFYEETGVETAINDWREYAFMVGPDWSCAVYCLGDGLIVDAVKTTTEEKIEVFSTKALPNTISNVPWLIAMAKDSDRFHAQINY
jgi:8-oxo-dGTP diphosphatase